jgi:hypothetical protein
MSASCLQAEQEAAGWLEENPPNTCPFQPMSMMITVDA